jgi:phosphoglycolate phosphatase-like HAD superfamily hydrolase
LTARLALFDLDGTLFLTHDPLSGRALVATLEQVYGVEVAGDARANVEHRGLSAKRIARNVLRVAGVTDAAVDERLDAWCVAFADRYLGLLAEADTSAWQVRRGAAAGLARLQAEGVRLALVTGTPSRWPEHVCQGSGSQPSSARRGRAFGCEAEDRAALLELARQRAGDWPAAAIAEIGDTPEDVATAKAAGFRSIAVSSPRTRDRTELAGADELVDDMDGIVRALLEAACYRSERGAS